MNSQQCPITAKLAVNKLQNDVFSVDTSPENHRTKKNSALAADKNSQKMQRKRRLTLSNKSMASGDQSVEPVDTQETTVPSVSMASTQPMTSKPRTKKTKSHNINECDDIMDIPKQKAISMKRDSFDESEHLIIKIPSNLIRRMMKMEAMKTSTKRSTIKSFRRKKVSTHKFHSKKVSKIPKQYCTCNNKDK